MKKPKLIKLTNIGKHEKRDNRQIRKSDNQNKPFTNHSTNAKQHTKNTRNGGVTKVWAKYYR